MIKFEKDLKVLVGFLGVGFGWLGREEMRKGDNLLLPTVGPPIKRRAGLRRKQAGRGSYRGS